MKKKQLIEENRDLKRRLQFYIMITELNKTPIPEELYKKYACIKKGDGSIHDFFPRSDFERWENEKEYLQLKEIGAKKWKTILNEMPILD
ncbi:hypothetical protein [Lactococcus lactis]|uniref:Uncharacterized protein n=1 Tax=Lactococcus lactis subsp. lactis TaxID=1360 RepID=A0A0V8EAS2_LACLL|nr:hypothetical protein [Lactococcus lactis]KSU22909.1 hypothetical protein M20_0419 [Lactococcus lactis subsp. lactis]